MESKMKNLLLKILLKSMLLKENQKLFLLISSRKKLHKLNIFSEIIEMLKLEC